MASNYPPGVSGNEPEIAGAWENEVQGVECYECGKTVSALEQVYSDGQTYLTCDECEHTWQTDNAFCCDVGTVGHTGRCQMAP